MYRKTIQFNKLQLSEQFETNLSGIDYQLTVSYNEVNDRLYITIADDNGTELVTNEKLVAGEKLFNDIVDVNLPSEDLVLIDETGKSTCVNFGNINQDIFITIDETYPGEMDPNNTNDGTFNPDGDEKGMDFNDDDDESDEDEADDADLDNPDDLGDMGGTE